MTLQEAIKSGKPFRRLGIKYWITDVNITTISNADILAEDWELKKEVREFTLYKREEDGQIYATDRRGSIVTYFGQQPPIFVAHVREIID